MISLQESSSNFTPFSSTLIFSQHLQTFPFLSLSVLLETWTEITSLHEASAMVGRLWTG